MRIITDSFPRRSGALLFALASTLLFASNAQAVSSAELYTQAGYQYGRFEARVQFAQGDGVVGAFFLWKDGSEQSGVFWNELDFEKVGADCQLQTNAFYGDPEAVHVGHHPEAGPHCGSFHTYTYEWTPDYLAWFVDGVEIRREEGDAALAYAENTPDGMQIRFNVWPGDSSFGGNFDPATLPVHQYVNWVQYSSYVDGAFQFEWREDFSAGTIPSGWLTGSWGSPKNLSTHAPANVNVVDGYAVLSLTADDATGPAGAAPLDPEDPGPPPAPSATADPPTPTPTATDMASDMSSSSDPGAEGCSLRARPGERAGGVWLLLALGLVLGRARRRTRH